MKNMVLNAWWAIAEPKRVTTAMVVAYLLFVVQGIFNCIQPMVDILTVDWVRTVVNFMLIVGGVVGAVACYKGYWLFEKPAMMAIATAYGVHLVWVLCDLDANGIIEQGKAVRIPLVILFLYTRYERIKGSLVNPEKD